MVSRVVMAAHRSAEVRASLLRVRRGIFCGPGGVVSELDILMTVDIMDDPVSLDYDVA